MRNYTLHKKESFKIFCLGLITSLLLGCGEKGISDLKKYVANIKAIENPHVDPMPEYQHIPPYFYAVQNLRDPFVPIINTTRNPNVAHFIGANDSKDNQDTCSIRPNSRRIRVGLEQMPLDALVMSGLLEMDGIIWALMISKNDGTIFRVRQGDYIGDNEGKIVDISEGQIDIMELLPDGKGCWTYEN